MAEQGPGGRLVDGQARALWTAGGLLVMGLVDDVLVKTYNTSLFLTITTLCNALMIRELHHLLTDNHLLMIIDSFMKIINLISVLKSVCFTRPCPKMAVQKCLSPLNSSW